MQAYNEERHRGIKSYLDEEYVARLIAVQERIIAEAQEEIARIKQRALEAPAKNAAMEKQFRLERRMRNDPRIKAFLNVHSRIIKAEGLRICKR